MHGCGLGLVGVCDTLRPPKLVRQSLSTVSETILFEQERGIATLSFNHPERRNALGTCEIDAIEQALGALHSDTRVLVITSTDARIFCAGADLTQILDGTLDGNRFQAMTNRIAALPIPTIAALTGNVFGGGAELALSCDFRLAREGIVMRIPAAAIGLCYPVEGIARLTRRLGIGLAKRVLVAAETLSAEQMLSLGLLDALHPEEGLEQAVADSAAALLALAPMSVSSMLEIIRQLELGTLDRQRAEALANACSASDDLQEGLLAQREKRPPIFRNR